MDRELIPKMGATVNLIATVGTYGQIGLNGKLPWQDLPEFRAYRDEAAERFNQLTEDGIVVTGKATAETVRNRILSDRSRIYVEWDRERFVSPAALIGQCKAEYPDKHIWISGGQKVFELFVPFCDWHFILQVPYDGPADRYMPPLIPAWAVIQRGRDQQINQIRPTDTLPDGVILLMRHGFPIYFGPVYSIPQHEFLTEGTVAFTSQYTHDNIAASAAIAAKGRTIQ